MRSSAEQARRLNSPTAAFTLVELLVVIAILSIVTVVAIPVMLPALNSRAVREAARIVNTQLAAVQAQALANGRSAGLWIERLPGATDGSMDLYMAEVTQPYAGDTIGTSTATVHANSMAPAPRYYATLSSSDTSWIGLPVRPGDLIRFNYRGPWYAVTGFGASPRQPEYKNQLLQDDSTTIKNTLGTDSQGDYIKMSSTNDIAFDRIRSSSQTPNPTAAFNQSEYIDCQMPPTDIAMPYQIFRRPVKSAGSPVSLPTGAVIDLAFSGTASNPTLLSGTTGPVIVTFDRSGALEKLYFVDSNGTQHVQLLSESLYLLIGKREQLSSLETDGTKQNWNDLESIWIAVNPQSGLASTAENAAAPSGATTFTAPTPATVRAFAQSAQATGGR